MHGHGIGPAEIRQRWIQQTLFFSNTRDTSTMAPNLAESQHHLIRDMLLGGSLTQVEMTNFAGCSDRTIRNVGTNMRLFSKTKAPANGAGRQRLVTPPMLAALCDRLIEEPGLYRDEMAVFLFDEFDVSLSSISRALASVQWTRKVTPTNAMPTSVTSTCTNCPLFARTKSSTLISR